MKLKEFLKTVEGLSGEEEIVVVPVHHPIDDAKKVQGCWPWGNNESNSLNTDIILTYNK